MMIKKRLFLLLLAFNGYVDMLYANLDLTFEECYTQHISKSWPRALLHMIEEFQPPQELYQKLEQLLLTEDNVKLLCDFRNHNDADAHRQLEHRGFHFLGSKLHVFEFDTIPGYVFKIAHRGELANLLRIEQARILRDFIARNGKEDKIIIPKKYAYILPLYENINYRDQPKIVVIAEKVDRPEPPLSNDDSHDENYQWLQAQGIYDLNDANVYALPDGKTALIDTETTDDCVLIEIVHRYECSR